MTIFASDWPDGADAVDVLLGEPMLPDCESEGEARATLELPPPLVLGAPPPPCDAEGKAAAEEAKCEAAWEAMVLERPEDSSWPCECCCCDPDCDGEKGDDVDDADEVRLMMRRVPDDATEGGLLTGEKEDREGLLAAELVRVEVKAVEMGVRPRRPLGC